MTNKELFMFSNRNKGGGTPQPSPPDVPYSDWIPLAEIPSGTTVIPANAFNGFSNLRNVVINDGLTAIGSYAFYDCTALKNIEIPNSVVEIGTQAIGYGSNGKIAGVTIYTDYETAAEEYAQENNIDVVYNSGTFTYIVDNDNVIRITGFTQGRGDYVIVPKSIDGLPVRRIVQSVFVNSTIKSLKCTQPLVGFMLTSYNYTSLPSTLEKLQLPNTITYMASTSGLLSNCSNLTEIILENGFSYPLVCNNCPLTQQSLVNMFNALADLTGEQAQTLAIGSANLAKLTNEQIAIATEKNWTLA